MCPDHLDWIHTWMYYDYDYDSVWLQQIEARQLQVGVLQNPCYHDMPGMASQTQGLRQPCHVDPGPAPGLNAEIRWEPGWIWPGGEHTKRSPRTTTVLGPKLKLQNHILGWTIATVSQIIFLYDKLISLVTSSSCSFPCLSLGKSSSIEFPSFTRDQTKSNLKQTLPNFH